MPWVRFDDRYRLHRKIRPLSDRLFRLATEAIMWSASEENLTDGRIERVDLPDIRPKATVADAKTLVDRGVWHQASQPCDSPTCPPPNLGTGWRIHDYFDYQPSREKVITDRAAKAERQRNWQAAKRRSTNASTNASTGPPRDASEDALLTPTPYPVPAPPRPERAGGDYVPSAPAARRGAAEPAGDGEVDDQNRVAAAESPPNGHQPIYPPADRVADIRATIAAAQSRMRRPPSRDAMAELREATPGVDPFVEPESEAS